MPLTFFPRPSVLMIRHTFKIALGIILVIIGLIGGIIPIFQGWIFGIPGLIILANYFPPVKRFLHWAKDRFGFDNNSGVK